MDAATQKAMKRRFEKRLTPKLNRLFRSIVFEFGRSIENNGAIPGLPSEPLRTILFQHTHQVGRLFSKQIRSKLPRNLRATPQENQTIDIQLGILWNKRADSQVELINGTTQRQMAKAWERTQKVVREMAESDPPQLMSMRETSIMAMNFLKKSMFHRAQDIAVTETQYSAEASKFIETGVLVRDEATSMKVLFGSDVRKRWDSMGDSKVRTFSTSSFDHLFADGQLQSRADAFSVSGEFLMFPGDTSLGASLGNIVNCRCSSDTLVSDVIIVRAGFEDTLIPVSQLPKPLLPPKATPTATIEGTP